MLDLNTVDWGDEESLVGLVFLAVAYPSGITNVKGLYGKICDVAEPESGQRKTKFNVRFYQSKAAARSGTGVVVKELPMTVIQLKGHAGARGGESGDESGDAEGDSTADPAGNGSTSPSKALR